jgi:hypothetical protein
MATTIINPTPTTNASGNNGIGFLIGAIVLVVFVVIFFIYGLPLLRSLSGNGGVQVNIPKSINVSVQQSK